MISIPGVGAIIRNKENHVFMIYTSRRGMKRWELPTRMITNGESLYMSLYKCIEDESSYQILPRIKRPVCFALNASRQKARTFFGMFFECSSEVNEIKNPEQLTEHLRKDIPKGLSQKLIKTEFLDWRRIDAKEIHPQHLKILQILDQNPEAPFFTIKSDADEECAFYTDNDITLKPVVLGAVAANRKPKPIANRRPGKIVDLTTHVFEVALTFPGEIREETVKPVADILNKKLGKDQVFYDNHYISQLAVLNLDVLLQDIYLNRSKLIVVFLCAAYAEKQWCGLEFRAIRELIKRKVFRKIMFVRTDDADIEGIFGIDGYVDGKRYSPAQIADLILERVKLNKNLAASDTL